MRLFIFALLLALGNTQDLTASSQNVVVLLGEDAVVPCTYKTTLTGVPTIKWYSATDGKKLLYTYVPENDSETKKNPSVRRDLYVTDEGSLQILETTVSDNRKYGSLECEVTIEGTPPVTANATLTIVALPTSDPKVEIVSKQLPVSADKTSIGSCESGYAYPAPKVTFYKEGEGTETDSSEMISDTSDEMDDDFFGDFLDDGIKDYAADGTISVKRTLLRSISPLDDKAVFYCLVESGKGGKNTTMVQKVPFPEFRVQYATDNVTIYDVPSPMFEGEDVEVKCKANGFPDPKIRFNNKETKTFTKTLERSDDNRNITCVASNDGNPVSDSVTLNVLWADIPKIEGSFSNIKLGDEISASCMSDSKPKPKRTFWKKGDDVVSESGDLTISNVNFNNAGVYTCVVENKHKQLTRKANTPAINITGIKLVGSKKEMFEAKEKEDLEFVCEVESYPAPAFKWTRRGQAEDAAVESLVSPPIENLGMNKYRSVWNIKSIESTESHMTYMCEISNGVSAPQTKNFQFKEIEKVSTVDPNSDNKKDDIIKESSPTAIIIIAVLVGIIVVAILLAVLYNKGVICAKKSEDGEEDAKDIAVRMTDEDPEAAHPQNDYATAPNATNDEQQAVGEETELMNGTDK